MKRRTFFTATAAVALAITFFAGYATAQQGPGWPEIKEPLGGQPAPGAKPSVRDFDEEVVYHRAFEVVVWSQPAAGVYGIRRGLVALGIEDNQVMAMCCPAVPRTELLTANNAAPYIAADADLRSGPVVLEVPAASDKGVLYGQVVDAWQETIAGVGPSGLDKGRGGKYLFLPPGYKENPPEGYFAIPSPNNRIQFAFRSVKLPGMTDADAHAYAETLKMYPLSEAAHPKPTRFVDAWPDRLSTLPFYDFRYFQDLYDALSVEPVRPRDRAMMDMLKTLGIETGKPFNPPPKYKAAMERGVVDAYFWMQDRFFKVQANNLFYPDRHWTWYFLPDAEDSVNWDLPNGLFYTARSDMYHPGTYYPPRLPRLDQISEWAREEGKLPPNAYLISLADNQGRPLEPGKNYKLRVPADMPVKQFWALIIYDFDTWAFIYNPLHRAGLTTYDIPNMKKNADGSVTIYFGPKAPAGLESNWIPTQGKRPIPCMRFYGGTEVFWGRSFTLPDVEPVE